MRSHRRMLRWLPFATLLLPALAAGASATYFPLAQGNRWHAVGESRSVTVDPSGAVVSRLTATEDYLRTIDGTEERFGRTYTIMREDLAETVDGVPTAGLTSWFRYRQDGSGLYEADVSLSTPPGGEAALAGAAPRAALLDRLVRDVPAAHRDAYRTAWTRLHTKAALIREAARGLGATGKLDPAASRAIGADPARAALENELTRLSYPLRPGREWQIRPDPLFTSEVEAIEPLTIPAGRFPSSRIRIDSVYFGPQDRVHVWFSRSGQLAFEYHIEGDATDVDGNVIGHATYDYREELQDLDIAAR